MNLREITRKQKVSDSRAEYMRSIAKKKISDSQMKRVQDKTLRSGGSGSLRSSIFNRTDEALTKEAIKQFSDVFVKEMDMDVTGGNLQGTNGKKKVCKFYVTIPDKVPMGNKVDALLAKVDYDKNNHTFTAYYRPKNGRWGQAETVDQEV